MIITRHAQQRWGERFAHRFPMTSLRDEFNHAVKCKANKLRQIGLRMIDTNRRYYVTDLCIFIVDANTHSLITVLPRRL